MECTIEGMNMNHLVSEQLRQTQIPARHLNIMQI